MDKRVENVPKISTKPFFVMLPELGVLFVEGGLKKVNDLERYTTVQ